MLNSIRFGFVFAGFSALALFLGLVSVVEAATITADITGDWSVADNWIGGILPTENDDVVIGDNVVITLDQDFTVNSIFISGGDDATGIIIPGNESLTVNGNVTFEAPVDDATSAIGVGSGSLTVGGNLEIVSGATGAEISVVYVGDGELDVEGDITFDGTAAAARLVATGVATISVAGNLESSGTFTRSLSNVIFDGEGDQDVGAHEYYSVTIDKASGTATLLNDSFMFGSLDIVSGSFSTDVYDLDITGPTTIRSGATLTHGAGHKIQNGNLIIEEGGAWIETGNPTVDFLGHVTNNGTFTAGTGLHGFLNFERSINGTFSIPNVSLNDNAIYTNNGTLTISTSLGGGGHFINGAGATLNIGDDLIDDAEDGLTFTASAEGNTVNYNRAGAQTVAIPTGDDYYNLTFSGSGTKSVGSALTIAGDLSIDSGAKASLTGDSTSNQLFLNESLQIPGTFGSSASNASDRNNTYFAGTGMVTVAVGAPPPSPSSSGSSASPAMLARLGITPGGGGADDNRLEIEKLLAQIRELQALILELQKAQMSDSPNPVNFKCEPFLRLGSKGEEVKILQTKLGILADGVFGKDTEKALRDFQAEKGLMSDGIAGPESCMAV